jgi:hypothetical protein
MHPPSHVATPHTHTPRNPLIWAAFWVGDARQHTTVLQIMSKRAKEASEPAVAWVNAAPSHHEGPWCWRRRKNFDPTESTQGMEVCGVWPANAPADGDRTLRHFSVGPSMDAYRLHMPIFYGVEATGAG